MSLVYRDKQLRVEEKSNWKLGFKQIDIDFHFSEFARDLLVNTKPSEMMKQVKDSGADTVMVYAKDHWGHVYHETRIAHKHAAAKGDLLKEWLTEAKKLGLQTQVFFSLMWDEYAARNNPDWLSKNADGSVKRWYGGWRFLSLNSPYRDYIFAHMRELVSHYDFDLIFVDPFNHRMGVNVPDYNIYDQRLYRAEYGTEIPKVLRGEEKARYMDFRDKFFARFLSELYSVIRSVGKDIRITHIYGGNTDYDDYLNVEGDPFGQDYYIPSMKAKVYRAYAQGRPLLMLTERFNRYFDFVPKTREQLTWETATAFSHQARMMFVDHADIKGEISKSGYRDMSWVFGKAAPIEREIVKATRVIRDVALIYHERDEELLYEPKEDLQGENQFEGTVYRGYTSDFVGAFKYLTETHVPFDCIVQSQITDVTLKDFKMVIVPNILHMSIEQIEAIQRYVENGGKVVFTYRSASKDLSTRPHTQQHRLFGLVEIDIEDPYSVRYVSPTIESEIQYIRVNRENAYVTPKTPFNTLGLIQLTAVERTSERWVTHNEPPGELTNRPAVIIGNYGKGEYAYFSFRVFTELVEQDVKLYRTYIEKILTKIYSPTLCVQAPRTVEANFYESSEGIKVFLTSMTVGRLAGRYDLPNRKTPEPYSFPCNIEEVIPVLNVQIIVRNGTVTSASDSGNNKLAVQNSSGVTTVTLPVLNQFEVVTLK